LQGGDQTRLRGGLSEGQDEQRQSQTRHTAPQRRDSLTAPEEHEVRMAPQGTGLCLRLCFIIHLSSMHEDCVILP